MQFRCIFAVIVVRSGVDIHSGVLGVASKKFSAQTSFFSMVLWLRYQRRTQTRPTSSNSMISTDVQHNVLPSYND